MLLYSYNIIIMRFAMAKKLTQIGTSWGVIIPKAILEMMDINPVLDTIDFDLENKVLKISKVKGNKN